MWQHCNAEVCRGMGAIMHLDNSNRMQAVVNVALEGVAMYPIDIMVMVENKAASTYFYSSFLVTYEVAVSGPLDGQDGVARAMRPQWIMLTLT